VSATQPRIRFGIIGLGRMGQNHLRVLSLLNSAEVRFVFDMNSDLTARVAGQAGVSAAESVDAVLDEVDAVIIASPTTTHEGYARQCADRVRNIFVEKPMTDRLDTSLGLQELAAEKGLNLQVGFIERFNPAVGQMKQLLDRSEQVVSIDFARTNKISARITDVDVVTDLMIHDIDLALHFSGPVTDVSAHGVAEGEMIDYAAALLTHSNGRFSRIQASRITDRKMRSIQATCKDMFIDCELLRKEITLSRQSEVEQRPGEPYRIIATEEKIEVRPHEALLLELQAFVASCHGEPTDGRPGAAEAVAAMEICDRVQRAIYGRR